jgi:Ca2+-binding EF-hand superfamily protein
MDMCELQFIFVVVFKQEDKLMADRIDRLISAFQVFDDAKSGKVPTAFMVSVLSQFGTPFSKEEAEEFKSDADENGFVDYTKFVQQVIFAPSQ